MNEKKNILCEVCGNIDINNFQTVYDKSLYIIVECIICKFVFIPQYYRQKISYQNYRDSEVLNEIRKANNWIKYKRQKLKINIIKNYMKDGKLFDVGTGWGHFLHTAKICGFDVEGIEISEIMHQYASIDLKLPVKNEDLYQSKLKENHYDIVTMWDVLEHLDHPSDAIRKIYPCLKKGGYLVLQVPQIDSFIAKKNKHNWSMLSIEHVNYFSKITIKKFLEDNGFEILKIKSSIEFKLFIMFILLPFVKRKRQKKKELTEKITNAERQSFFNKLTKLPHFLLVILIFFHNIIYKLLSFFEIGEEMIVIAKKK